jgi:hypothetical protein
MNNGLNLWGRIEKGNGGLTQLAVCGQTDETGNCAGVSLDVRASFHQKVIYLTTQRCLFIPVCHFIRVPNDVGVLLHCVARCQGDLHYYHYDFTIITKRYQYSVCN